jgi:hypothetical protein
VTATTSWPTACETGPLPPLRRIHRTHRRHRSSGHERLVLASKDALVVYCLLTPPLAILCTTLILDRTSADEVTTNVLGYYHLTNLALSAVLGLHLIYYLLSKYGSFSGDTHQSPLAVVIAPPREAKLPPWIIYPNLPYRQCHMRAHMVEMPLFTTFITTIHISRIQI